MPDGKSTVRDNVKMAAGGNAKLANKMLKGPPLPESMVHLWRWFIELHRGRTINGNGPTRANYQDIMAWQKLYGARPQPWELRALMSLGTLWVNINSEEIATIAKPDGRR